MDDKISKPLIIDLAATEKQYSDLPDNILLENPQFVYNWAIVKDLRRLIMLLDSGGIPIDYNKIPMEYSEYLDTLRRRYKLC